MPPMDGSRMRKHRPAGFDPRPALHKSPASAGIIHREDNSMDSFEEIRINAPVPGTCKICATVHKPDQPHDRDSLYYQNWFRKRYKRFPTWGDAMAHCTAVTRAMWKAKLSERGILVDD